ncbi:hypothetical protein [Sphingomonas sp. MMS24-J13]|uniref:hypothetical protein n=1 Tax=Sphingomonas sp. MMS24-J13 TaxID=3238686 RepID=UPI00384C5455
MHEAGQPAWIPFILPVVIAIVLALRLRGMRRARRLRLETLAIVPAIYFVVFAVSLWEYPPVGLLNWLELGVATAVGGALGWRRGKLMRITVDPATHALNQQSSPAALLFIVLLIVARSGLRYEGAAMGLNVLQVTGLLLAFGLGLFTATRIEMFLRARRLLEEARAA